MSENYPFFAPTLAAAAFVIPGLFDMPYGYYMLLRLVLCGVSAYGLVLMWRRHTGLGLLLGMLVVLYNPILPVHLGEKELWVIVNLVTLGVFAWVAKLYKRSDSETE